MQQHGWKSRLRDEEKKPTEKGGHLSGSSKKEVPRLSVQEMLKGNTPLGKWGGSLERLGTIRLRCRSAPCEGERGWRKVCKEEYWLDGNILDHHAVLKKLSKTDGQSLSQSCRSVELPIFQEWAALMSLPHPVKGWSSLWEACPPTDTVMMDFRAQQNRL